MTIVRDVKDLEFIPYLIPDKRIQVKNVYLDMRTMNTEEFTDAINKINSHHYPERPFTFKIIIDTDNIDIDYLKTLISSKLLTNIVIYINLDIYIRHFNRVDRIYPYTTLTDNVMNTSRTSKIGSPILGLFFCETTTHDVIYKTLKNCRYRKVKCELLDGYRWELLTNSPNYNMYKKIISNI